MTEAASSAAPERARLAAAAKACPGGRAARLSGGVPFSQLCQQPGWLKASDAEREKTASLAALLTIAPRLRRSVSGKIFAPLADTFGDAVLEAALSVDTVVAVADYDPEPDALRQAGAVIAGDALGGDIEATRLMTMACDLLDKDGTTEGEDPA